MDEADRRVFVYGTLRSGFANPGRDVLTTHGELLTEATVRGRLHDLGAFPALVRSPEAEGRVHGEIYELVREPETALVRLDRYEGARGPDPLPYERVRVDARLPSGDTVDVWTYVWTDEPEGPPVEGGDWIAYLDRDPQRPR